MHVGTPAVIVPTGFGGRYAASVRHIDKVIDAASGTIVARVELANPDGSVPSGVRCRAELGVGGAAPEARAKRRVD